MPGADTGAASSGRHRLRADAPAVPHRAGRWRGIMLPGSPAPRHPDAGRPDTAAPSGTSRSAAAATSADQMCG